MFVWDKCKAELSRIYIEVGEIKESIVKSDDCVFIEAWVMSERLPNFGRPECEKIVRRTVYSVFSQIKEMIGDKQACIVIMSNDVGEDSIEWSPSIALLFKYLVKEDMLRHSMFYTKHTQEEIEDMQKRRRWRRDEDNDLFDFLLETLDVFVYEQPNCYTNNKSEKICTTRSQIPLLLQTFIDFFSNDM